MNGVSSITMDQCQYGQKDEKGNPIKKPTRWMSNCPSILSSLSKRCTGNGGGAPTANTTRSARERRQSKQRSTRSSCAEPFLKYCEST